MKNIAVTLLALANAAFTTLAATNHAAEVVSYDPGLDHAAGYTNREAVLGEPSRVNPFGEPVDPFNPPYGPGQVLSIGAGGALTVRFLRPISNAPRRPFGIDFIIFGNSGFVITNEFDPINYGWIGTPATDGSLFANHLGTTRVSVSRNGRRFFTLEPERAPALDNLFPTDSAGRFDVPVDPALTAASFAGATIEDLRALYGGSAGGAGFNIGWARNQRGKRVYLGGIRYVRVEVLQGKVEIDGLVAAARRNAGRPAR